MTDYRRGSTVWWNPAPDRRPAGIPKTREAVAAWVESVNQSDHTAVIGFFADATRTEHRALVNFDELRDRPLPVVR